LNGHTDIISATFHDHGRVSKPTNIRKIGVEEGEAQVGPSHSRRAPKLIGDFWSSLSCIICRLVPKKFAEILKTGQSSFFLSFFQSPFCFTSTTMASLSVSAIVGLLVGSALGVNNGLARTPQMGWVSSEKL
jgi:hypothetical protein